MQLCPWPTNFQNLIEYLIGSRHSSVCLGIEWWVNQTLSLLSWNIGVSREKKVNFHMNKFNYKIWSLIVSEYLWQQMRSNDFSRKLLMNKHLFGGGCKMLEELLWCTFFFPKKINILKYGLTFSQEIFQFFSSLSLLYLSPLWLP